MSELLYGLLEQALRRTRTGLSWGQSRGSPRPQAPWDLVGQPSGAVGSPAPWITPHCPHQLGLQAPGLAPGCQNRGRTSHTILLLGQASPLQERTLHSPAAQARAPGVPPAPHTPLPPASNHPQVSPILLSRKLSNMPLVLYLYHLHHHLGFPTWPTPTFLTPPAPLPRPTRPCRGRSPPLSTVHPLAYRAPQHRLLTALQLPHARLPWGL